MTGRTTATQPILLVIGPTAGGKSSLAMAIARTLRDGLVDADGNQGRSTPTDAEIVSADAYQIYQGMDKGTAKPTADEQAEVRHHLIDIRDPADPERYTVHHWLADAHRAIDDITARGSLPIVVGGTHLYAKALVDGLFEGPPPDDALRARLRDMPQPERRAKLEAVDPAAADRIHPNDLRRTIRALEIFEQTGRPISELQAQWDAAPPESDDRAGQRTGSQATPKGGPDPDTGGDFSRGIDAQAHRDRIRVIGLRWEPEDLNPRINARVKAMLEAGLEAEARELWLNDRLGPQAIQALGYKQLVDHFERRCSRSDAIERIKIETRRFAKNQRTWLRRFRTKDTLIWVVPSQSGAQADAQIVVKESLM